ncbi:MAG: helix-turn-helix domain-containing protein [Rhodobacteraceae bacterium]|nr:helix-turn-helix domain-containing protein [Paracoccaceae bacterium]
MTDQKSKLQKYSAPALEKGLDILEFLSITDAAPSLSQLAAGIGRSKSEIFRMMIVLEERGYIRRRNGDQFVLTDQLSKIGIARSVNNKIAELARPILSELSESTKYSCHLSVFDNLEFLVVASATLPTSYGLSVQIGHRSQVMNSSGGACLIAFGSPQFQEIIWSHQTIKIHSEAGRNFQENIVQCKRDLYIELPSPEARSIFELSTPILGPSSQNAIAILTIPYLTTDAIANRRSHIIEKLLQAAQVLKDKIEITLPNLGSLNQGSLTYSG